MGEKLIGWSHPLVVVNGSESQVVPLKGVSSTCCFRVTIQAGMWSGGDRAAHGVSVHCRRSVLGCWCGCRLKEACLLWDLASYVWGPLQALKFAILVLQRKGRDESHLHQGV